MAIVANTFQTYQAIGRREDLANTIYNISPSDTPFMSMVGRSKATNTLAEWQTDALDAVAANAKIEGDEYAYSAVTPTVRIGNYTQISTKTVIVAGTQQVVNNAGRDSEMAYQLAKSSKALKRDMESALTGKVAKAVGATGTARTLGGYETWTTSNVSRGGGSPAGSGAGNGAAPVDAGTKRAFTETLLKAVIQSAYSSGGDPSILMVGPFNKGVVSGFAGRTTARQMIDATKIQAAADLYSSDFGDFKVIPNRFSREQTGYVIDPEYWSVAYLRDFKQEEVAKTGDAIKRALLVEYTLIAKNQAASGVVADLTTS
tara:strand:- start:265 stop:1212 length:948 start_codon:yes stop_codon:yes gene_type:complete